MKCCLSTDVGTWTNWLTFEPDPVYSPDAGTGLLSPISYALQPGILLRRKNPMYRYWAPVAAATRGFKMVLFTESRGNNFVRRTCAPPSALLVVVDFFTRFYTNVTTTSSPYVMSRLSVVCLSLSLLHHMQRLELFGNIFPPPNSLGIRTVWVKILEKKFKGF